MTTKNKYLIAFFVVAIICAVGYYFHSKKPAQKKQRQPLTVAFNLAEQLQQDKRPVYDKTKPVSISNRPGANLPT